jgi:hypothetical protein
MHLAAGWSFRHRRTVLIGWPPPYPPAEAGRMNASRTVAFASLAPVAAAQDAPAAARPSVAGRPRGTARRPRPDPQLPSDREGRGDALLLGGAEKQGLPGNRGRQASPTPPGSPPTASPWTPANPVRKISRLIAENLRSGRLVPHRCLARLVPGRRSRRAVSNRPRPRPGPSPSPRSAPAPPESRSSDSPDHSAREGPDQRTDIKMTEPTDNELRPLNRHPRTEAPEQDRRQRPQDSGR